MAGVNDWSGRPKSINFVSAMGNDRIKKNFPFHWVK